MQCKLQISQPSVSNPSYYLLFYHFCWKMGSIFRFTAPYPCPGAGCASAPVCGGPCKRCCPPLAEKWVKKRPSSGASPVSGQGVSVFSCKALGRGTDAGRVFPFLGQAGIGAKRRKGCSPLDGTKRRRNGGLLQSAIRRFVSQSARIHGR